MGKKNKSNVWAEAKKRCRLNQADIQMAKELSMNPKSLIKNIPSSNQKWKAPVKVWIRDLYEEKFGRTLDNPKTEKNRESRSKNVPAISDEELPF
ncbi:hypothetical protein [Virgibacillus oceani]|uniref:Uncharacterized protein n=1 Tax=Virgibacillus oceani TaxID=1479511 RepID=A0A917M7V1_9BACI|nr:hypothetical protein [Virgibacillus oceani]GGG82913.1 hypothetical protein GCM10011398_30580 [Virgibacillus oceani]